MEITYCVYILLELFIIIVAIMTPQQFCGVTLRINLDEMTCIQSVKDNYIEIL